MLIIAVLSGIVGMLDCVTLKSVLNILIKVAKLLLNHHVPPNSVTKWELVSHLCLEVIFPIYKFDLFVQFSQHTY